MPTSRSTLRRAAAGAAVLAAALTACGGGDEDNPTVTAPTETATSAAPAGTPAAGSLTVSGRDYSFVGLTDFAPKAGTTVAFTFKNISTDTPHDFVVTDADGQRVGGVDSTDPGAEKSGTLNLSKAGTYTYVCTIGNHQEKGMEGTFTAK